MTPRSTRNPAPPAAARADDEDTCRSLLADRDARSRVRPGCRRGHGTGCFRCPHAGRGGRSCQPCAHRKGALGRYRRRRTVPHRAPAAWCVHRDVHAAGLASFRAERSRADRFVHGDCRCRALGRGGRRDDHRDEGLAGGRPLQCAPRAHAERQGAPLAAHCPHVQRAARRRAGRAHQRQRHRHGDGLDVVPRLRRADERRAPAARRIDRGQSSKRQFGDQLCHRRGHRRRSAVHTGGAGRSRNRRARREQWCRRAAATRITGPCSPAAAAAGCSRTT